MDKSGFSQQKRTISVIPGFFTRVTYLFFQILLIRLYNDSGIWSKKEQNLYAMRLVTGEISDGLYDSFDDSMYMSGLPQMKYQRLKRVITSDLSFYYRLLLSEP